MKYSIIFVCFSFLFAGISFANPTTGGVDPALVEWVNLQLTSKNLTHNWVEGVEAEWTDSLKLYQEHYSYLVQKCGEFNRESTEYAYLKDLRTKVQGKIDKIQAKRGFGNGQKEITTAKKQKQKGYKVPKQKSAKQKCKAGHKQKKRIGF